MPNLYHFTSSAQFPRIIRSGELRPMEYKGEPRDFVHATDNKHGEKTAAGWWTWDDLYRRGVIARVRFTLATDDFTPWLEALARYSEWNAAPEFVEKLQKAARELGQSTQGWYCRPDPLPLSKVIACHTRTYTGHRWEPFDITAATIREATNTKPVATGTDMLGIKIDHKFYWSEQSIKPDGHFAYNVATPVDAGISQAVK